MSSFRSHWSIVQVLPEWEQRCEACVAFSRSRSFPLIFGRQGLGLWLQEFPNAPVLTAAKQLLQWLPERYWTKCCLFHVPWMTTSWVMFCLFIYTASLTRSMIPFKWLLYHWKLLWKSQRWILARNDVVEVLPLVFLVHLCNINCLL